MVSGWLMSVVVEGLEEARPELVAALPHLEGNHGHALPPLPPAISTVWRQEAASLET